MSLRIVKKELNKMDKAEIIKLISELYKKVPDAKVYLDIYATADIAPIVEKYKKEIEKYVYPSGRQFIMREKEARKLIRKVRKLDIPILNVELELHYVKCCLEIIGDFGYDDDYYINAMGAIFYSAADAIQEIESYDKFDKMLRELSDVASVYGIELEYY